MKRFKILVNTSWFLWTYDQNIIYGSEHHGNAEEEEEDQNIKDFQAQEQTW